MSQQMSERSGPAQHNEMEEQPDEDEEDSQQHM